MAEIVRRDGRAAGRHGPPTAGPATGPSDRLRRWERVGLVGLAVVFLAFGVLVELRSAFQRTSKTDFGVYVRAAWAVRAGADPYAVTDSNSWHYCYPPPLAIFLVPLADPPPGADRSGYLPFSVSVAVWYLFGIACVFWSTHKLAGAVLPDEPEGTRRWWYARTVPFWVCFGSVGFTLGRGQVNLLVVALVAGAFAAVAAGRRFASGAWLAGAVTVKVIPGLLLLFPLLRGDRRALLGVAAGLVVLLGVLPAAVWGVGGAVEMNRRVVELVLKPGATGEGDQTRAEELTDTISTDSQSFVAAIHAHLYPNPQSRPRTASSETRLAHWAIGAALVLVTAAVGWRVLRRAGRVGDGRPADQLVLLGCLCVLMVLLSPVSHMHYYAMVLPLVAGLWLRGMAARPGSHRADPLTTAALTAWGALTALPLLPGPTFDRLREAGFGTAATVGLWAFAVWTIGRPVRAGGVSPLSPPLLRGLTPPARGGITPA
jgi:alpha-1,2-mannosyltransferase